MLEGVSESQNRLIEESPDTYSMDSRIVARWLERPRRFADVIDARFPDRPEFRAVELALYPRANPGERGAGRDRATPVTGSVAPSRAREGSSRHSLRRLDLTAPHHLHEFGFGEVRTKRGRPHVVVYEYLEAPILAVHPFFIRRGAEGFRAGIPRLVFTGAPWRQLGDRPAPDRLSLFLAQSGLGIGWDPYILGTGIGNPDTEFLLALRETWRMRPAVDGPPERLKWAGRIPPLDYDLIEWSSTRDVTARKPAANRSRVRPHYSSALRFFMATLFLPRLRSLAARLSFHPGHDARFAEQILYAAVSGCRLPGHIRALDSVARMSASVIADCVKRSAWSRLGDWMKRRAHEEADHVLMVEEDPVPLFSSYAAYDPGAAETVIPRSARRGWARLDEVSHEPLQLAWNGLLAHHDASVDYDPGGATSADSRRRALLFLAGLGDHPSELKAVLAIHEDPTAAMRADFWEPFDAVIRLVEDAFRLAMEHEAMVPDARRLLEDLESARTVKAAYRIARRIHDVFLARAGVTTESIDPEDVGRREEQSAPPDCFPLIPQLEPLRSYWIASTMQLKIFGLLARTCLGSYAEVAPTSPTWFFRTNLIVAMVSATPAGELRLVECLDAQNRATDASRSFADLVRGHLDHNPEAVKDAMMAVVRT